jgi:RNA polymerase sigma-70 factor (ECF subfamily)
VVTECEFLNIYNEFYQKIIQYLSRIAGPNDAEDIAQDVFDKISRNLGGFKRKSKLSTWIYRIATNTAIDRLRSTAYKHSAEHTSFEEAKGPIIENELYDHKQPAIDQSIIHKEMNGCIREYITNLAPDYRTVIVMSELEGMSNQKIADVLEISLDNVKVRLHRARTKLRQALDSGCVFYHNEQDILACDRKKTQILPKTPH